MQTERIGGWISIYCLNCRHQFALKNASHGELGWCAVCSECGSSFDIDLPGDSEKLQELLEYIRAREIVFIGGQYTVKFRCNPDTAENTLFSDSDCRECIKEGCHKHTVLMDAEKLLNGDN